MSFAFYLCVDQMSVIACESRVCTVCVLRGLGVALVATCFFLLKKVVILGLGFGFLGVAPLRAGGGVLGSKIQ